MHLYKFGFVRIEEELKLDYSDVLFRPKRSTLQSRKDVNLLRTYRFKYSKNEWSGIPIMAANMDGVGELGVAEKLSEYGMITCLTKQHDVKKIKQFKKIKSIYKNIAISIGTKKEDFENLNKVLREFGFIKFICIDVANGYSEYFSKFLKSVRDKYPTKTIIAGNVVTADMTQELILSGADIVKVGIGPGSVCTTRIQTGVGYPQLSAVIECADAAHGLGAHVIADGGCTCPGDVAKGFGGGADFVMLGGMLAGHDEGGGSVITKRFRTNEVTESGFRIGGKEALADTAPTKIEEKHFVEFYGMSSKSANNKHFGGLKDYRSSEGRTVLVPYRGTIANTVQNILGGIRSACTYAGAVRLKHLSRCTTFVRCTQTHNSIYENNTIGY